MSQGLFSNMWSLSRCCSASNIFISVIHRSRHPTLVFPKFCVATTRMSSSSSRAGQMLVGQSGRKYIRTRLLKSDTSQYQRSVYVAESEGQMFVLKRMPKNAYDMCQQFNAKFAGSRRLRLHIDENEEERTLIYGYFRGNLFHSMNAYKQVPPVEAVRQIMWKTGKALEEMHRQKMMHVDLKPDNILLHWRETQLPGGAAGPPEVDEVIVSDLDGAFDVATKGAWCMYPAPEYRDARFGNFRWRAPEMQTGMGIGLFSDVFAYALTYLYTLIGQVPLGIDDFDKIAEQAGMLPEELALGKTIEYFGPVTPEFLKHTGDEQWQKALQGLQDLVDENLDPQNRFENWTVQDFPRLAPSVKEMLSKMVTLNPSERLSMHQVMEHPSWGQNA